MRLSLRVFLFVSLSIAALAPIAYLGATQIVRWREVQRHDADKQLRFAAESLARAIGQALDESVRGLTATANHIGTYGTLDHDTLQAVLHDYCSSFPSCLGVNISDLDARPFVIEPPEHTKVHFADRGYYQEMLRTGRTAVSGVEMGRITRVPTIHLCAPIWRAHPDGSKDRIGSLVNAIGLGYLQSLTTRSVEVFGTMHARVLDQQMRLIVDSDPLGPPPLSDFAGIAMYAAPLNGEALLRDGENEHGAPVRAALARITEQQLGWTVVVMLPISKIEEQARRAWTTTLIAVLGTLGLGVAFAFVLSSWLARPISRLARYTQRVASGGGAAAPSPGRWDAREVTDLVATVGSMVTKLRSQADALREHEQKQVLVARLKREIEIAEHIQTGILPTPLAVPGFDIAALMKPAEVVGGDYYDLLPTESGLWIGVGDVSGHGLTAGLVMVMLQSALGALAVHTPEAKPAEIWRAANRLLVDNIRSRMGGDDHVTLVLIHMAEDGRFAFVGGHEPILLLRAGAPKCEILQTPGPWMGIRPDLDLNLVESTGHLGPGDLLVLHSDGISEAGASQRNAFGIDRLCAVVERLREQSPQTIAAAILQEAGDWLHAAQEDDMTAVVVRRTAD